MSSKSVGGCCGTSQPRHRPVSAASISWTRKTMSPPTTCSWRRGKVIARSNMRSAIRRSAWPPTRARPAIFRATRFWPARSARRYRKPAPPRSGHRIHLSPWARSPVATSANSSIRSGAHRCTNGTNKPAVCGKTSASGSAPGTTRNTAKACRMRSTANAWPCATTSACWMRRRWEKSTFKGRTQQNSSTGSTPMPG